MNIEINNGIKFNGNLTIELWKTIHDLFIALLIKRKINKNKAKDKEIIHIGRPIQELIDNKIIQRIRDAKDT